MPPRVHASMCLYEMVPDASRTGNASEERKEDPFALEETTARTISEVKRPKFLMSDPDRGNLRLPSGEFEKFQRNVGNCQVVSS